MFTSCEKTEKGKCDRLEKVIKEIEGKIEGIPGQKTFDMLQSMEKYEKNYNTLWCKYVPN